MATDVTAVNGRYPLDNPVNLVSYVCPTIARKSANTSICQRQVISITPPNILGKLLQVAGAENLGIPKMAARTMVIE